MDLAGLFPEQVPKSWAELISPNAAPVHTAGLVIHQGGIGAADRDRTIQRGASAVSAGCCFIRWLFQPVAVSADGKRMLSVPQMQAHGDLYREGGYL